MAKIIVPKANEQEKVLFEKLGITLREFATPEELEEVIVHYLDTHNVLHLATCRNDEPRSTPLEYFNNCLTVFIMSEGGGKFANLKENDRVAYSISDPYDPVADFFGAKGLQCWGRAKYFNKNDDLNTYAEVAKYKRPNPSLAKIGLDKIADAFNFKVVIIEPEKFRFLSLRNGVRNAEWRRE